ncbi:uncharacterized protein LOC121383200 [Gigantopelta aegis]|uniref:uncharacterized protein LOC121383200 n=2 Tax=Gigantopelta aegis TaxID=1735272 RepID=UPI001B88E718|nr:uncharacterized protein LOC121383200 [Gigantopelta aegis]
MDLGLPIVDWVCHKFYIRWTPYKVEEYYVSIHFLRTVNTTMEVIKNNKGGLKLIHEGYLYTKRYARKNIRWECSSRAAFTCKGGVTSDLEIKTIVSFTQHSHDPQDQSVAVAKLRSAMKERAGTSRGTLTQLLVDSISDTPVDVRAELGKPDHIKRALRRERAKHMPKNPTSLRDLMLDDEWTTSSDGDRFLIYDNGVDSSDRMLVFGTDDGLRHLASSESWFMDGTFTVAPLLFTQLYVIRVPLGESAVTCVYAFLPNKHQSTYEELFISIQDRCSELGFQADPVTVTLDFEQAVMNAVITTFGPQVNVHGCFYHLTQSTWRKIQSLGLVQRYREEKDVKLFCGMLDGLAFLPVNDVPEGMTYLRDNTPDGLEPLLVYFDSTYVSGSYRRIQPPQRSDGSVPPLCMRRIPPAYAPSIWNVHTITLKGGSRTNNICEGWNNSFAKLVGHAHPTIWRAIDSIRKDQTQAATARLMDERGERPAKRVRHHIKKLQTKLHNLCTDRRDDIKSISEVLKGIGHCVRWK